jgi:hypothetical protein
MAVAKNGNKQQPQREGHNGKRRNRNWRSGRSNHSALVTCVPKSLSDGFGLSEPTSVSNVYLDTGASTGAVTNNTEVGIRVTHFFDYDPYDSAAGGIAQGVHNFFWECNQNLFNNNTAGPSGEDATFCRVRKLSVWVLPQKGFTLLETQPNQTNATGMFTVNCQVPGTSGTTSGRAVATDTQVTNVLPQFDTMWKKVLTCDLQKTFQSGTIRPFFEVSGNSSAQCLFQMSVLDPVSGDNYFASADATTLGIRVKVQLDIDNPVAPVQNASLVVFRNEDFPTPATNTNGAAYVVPAPEYCQMKITGAKDSMS